MGLWNLPGDSNRKPRLRALLVVSNVLKYGPTVAAVGSLRSL